MYFKKIDKQLIDDLAIDSLNKTLFLFKPGLNRHLEARLPAYRLSIEYLTGIFGAMFDMGVEYSCVESSLCFDTMRIKGRVVENKLLNVTNNERTHFGALFSMGLMACAAGKLDALGIKLDLDYLITLIADLCKGYSYKSFVNLSTKSSELTCGERLYLIEANGSIRTAAEEGFSSLLNACIPFMNSASSSFKDLPSSIECSSNPLANPDSTKLFAIIASMVDDSRIILEHGLAVMEDVKGRFKSLWENYNEAAALDLDDYLNKNNIIPKAAMGMHSLCLFCYKLLNI